MSAYIDPVLIAMVSSAGMGREYTADDIAARARIVHAGAKEGLMTCVRRGLVEAVYLPQGARGYRLTDEGRGRQPAYSQRAVCSKHGGYRDDMASDPETVHHDRSCRNRDVL